MAAFGNSRIEESATPTMQHRQKPRRPIAVAYRDPGPRSIDDRRELALLAEFVRHHSVAALAGEIARRLGANVCDKDLIADAGLDPTRRRA